MKQDNKLWFVVGQVFVGLGFALAGAIATALIVALYDVLTGKQAGLLGDIIGTLIGSYIGMQAGILFDGYKYLKRRDQQKDFLRFSLQSIMGLIGWVLVFLKIVVPLGPEMPYALVNTLVIILPLTGAIAGFNFRWTPGRK